MNSSDELVSIIMPNHNNAPYLSYAIESVISQTYENWELIIVDDFSTDNSLEIINSYKDREERIRLYKHDSKMNAAAARNTALSHANGKYAAFLDADDYWHREKLEKQIRFMKENSIDFCCHAYSMVSPEGKIIGSESVPPEKTDYRDCLKLSNPIGNLTVIYNRDKLGTVFSPDIERRNDFAMWLEVLKKTDCCYGMKDVLAYHRVGLVNSLSRNKFRLIFYHWKLYHDIEGLSALESAYYILCWIKVKYRKLIEF